MNPRVSIIIPCHNAAAWLAQTLESALNQTWSHREVIVVDDGSTDDSLALARSYATRGVRVATQANRGASAARNHGLGLASGDYIQFLDADDLLAAEKIERQLGLLQHRGPDTVASGAWARFVHQPDEADFRPRPNWRDLGGVEFLRENFAQRDMMHPAAWLTPKSVTDRAGPWNESLTVNDDGEYFARVVLQSSGIAFCAAARSYYRSALPGSLSQRVDARSLQSLFRSVELTLAHLLAADDTPSTRAAAAYAWKCAAFEIYPSQPGLAREAERRSLALGGSRQPFPGSGRFLFLSRLLGWRLARRLTLRRTP